MLATLSPTGLQLAKWARAAIEDKKGSDVVILDVSKISSLADYFVIASGESPPQLKAMAEGVREALHEHADRKPWRLDGNAFAQWIVLDYSDVVIHLMHPEKRSHYDLERLWGDAKRVK